MTPELKPGYRWGRHWYLTNGTKKWTEWAVIEIWGSAPFLKGEVRFIPNASVNTEDPHLSIENHLDKWQFGPALNIPDRNWREDE